MNNAQSITIKSLKETVEYLASDKLGGRRPLTEGHKLAQVYLIERLQKLGARPAVKNGYLQPFDNGLKNILAILPDKNGSIKNPKVILSAHYDHCGEIGNKCIGHKLAKSEICNGAADNAGAVTAVLHAAELIKDKLDAPVFITLWDGEEMDLIGSKFFIQNPTIDLKSINLMINLDIIGLNLFKGFENFHFAVGSETGGKELKKDIEEVKKEIDLDLRYFSYALGHKRSDHANFEMSGKKIPHVFFTDGDGSIYHTSADEAHNINYTKVLSITKLIANIALKASNRIKPYKYSSPRRFKNYALPLHSDAVSLLGMFQLLKENSKANQIDLKKFQPEYDKLEEVAKGNSLIYSFHFGRWKKTALGARYLIGLSKKLPFIP